MKTQQGPKEIVIPAQRFMSCYGCEFHTHSMVHSGRDPKYADNCTHPNFGRPASWMGNLHKDPDGHLITPPNCPFIPKMDTAGTPGKGTSGNFLATQNQEHGGYTE